MPPSKPRASASSEKDGLRIVGEDAEMPSSGTGDGAEVSLVCGEYVEAVVPLRKHHVGGVAQIEASQICILGA